MLLKAWPLVSLTFLVLFKIDCFLPGRMGVQEFGEMGFVNFFPCNGFSKIKSF